MITFDEYQEGVLATWNKTLSMEEAITNAALGLGECGELQNLIKKMKFHGKLVPTDQIIDELGDILYYITMLGSLFMVSLETIAARNNEKLKDRYPNGFKEGVN